MSVKLQDGTAKFYLIMLRGASGFEFMPGHRNIIKSIPASIKEMKEAKFAKHAAKIMNADQNSSLTNV